MSDSPSFDLARVRALYKDPQANRKALFFLAQTAERAERYNDMCSFMKELVINNPDDLTAEEHNLLRIAFKSVVNNIRAAWRVCNTEDDDKYHQLRQDYRLRLEAELREVCLDHLEIFENVLCKSNTEEVGPRVMYLKVTGDYYRYLAELDDKAMGDKARQFYKQAMEVADDNLECNDPKLLGVALNYSVCLHQVFNEKDEAAKLAKRAFDRAISKLDDLDEASYMDSTLIMQLLRDNLTLWHAKTRQR